MSGTSATMRPEDDLADVVSLMLSAHVRSVPIVDDGDLVGIVTRRDALRVIAREERGVEEVRRRRDLPERPARRAGSPRGRMGVGDDGSPGAAAALRFALREAARRGAGVEVVSAFTVPAPWPVVYGVPQVPTPRGMATEIERELRIRAAAAADELRVEQDGRVPGIVVRAVPGEPGHVLSGASVGADLLVVGSRGRGAGASLLLGSVGLHCVLHAPSNVTVVPPGEVRTALRRTLVAEAMTRDVDSVGPDAPVAEIVAALRRRGVRALPVVAMTRPSSGVNPMGVSMLRPSSTEASDAPPPGAP